MDIYNSQTNSAATSPNQTERTMTSGTSNKVFGSPFRINVVNIKTNTNKIIFTKEDGGVSREEEKDYYKKTLKSKLI
ncbi:MAG: hypothetical protein WAV98_00900 [Minisyncoccia bacterium]